MRNYARGRAHALSSTSFLFYILGGCKMIRRGRKNKYEKLGKKSPNVGRISDFVAGNMREFLNGKV